MTMPVDWLHAAQEPLRLPGEGDTNYQNRIGTWRQFNAGTGAAGGTAPTAAPKAPVAAPPTTQPNAAPPKPLYTADMYGPNVPVFGQMAPEDPFTYDPLAELKRQRAQLIQELMWIGTSKGNQVPNPNDLSATMLSQDYYRRLDLLDKQIASVAGPASSASQQSTPGGIGGAAYDPSGGTAQTFVSAADPFAQLQAMLQQQPSGGANTFAAGVQGQTLGLPAGVTGQGQQQTLPLAAGVTGQGAGVNVAGAGRTGMSQEEQDFEQNKFSGGANTGGTVLPRLPGETDAAYSQRQNDAAIRAKYGDGGSGRDTSGVGKAGAVNKGAFAAYYSADPVLQTLADEMDFGALDSMLGYMVGMDGLKTIGSLTQEGENLIVDVVQEDGTTRTLLLSMSALRGASASKAAELAFAAMNLDATQLVEETNANAQVLIAGIDREIAQLQANRDTAISRGNWAGQLAIEKEITERDKAIKNIEEGRFTKQLEIELQTEKNRGASELEKLKELTLQTQAMNQAGTNDATRAANETAMGVFQDSWNKRADDTERYIADIGEKIETARVEAEFKYQTYLREAEQQRYAMEQTVGLARSTADKEIAAGNNSAAQAIQTTISEADKAMKAIDSTMQAREVEYLKAQAALDSQQRTFENAAILHQLNQQQAILNMQMQQQAMDYARNPSTAAAWWNVSSGGGAAGDPFAQGSQSGGLNVLGQAGAAGGQGAGGFQIPAALDQALAGGGAQTGGIPEGLLRLLSPQQLAQMQPSQAELYKSLAGMQGVPEGDFQRMLAERAPSQREAQLRVAG